MSQRTLPPRPAGNRPAASASRTPPTRHKPGRSIVDQRRTPWGVIAAVAAVVMFAGVIAVAIVAGNGHKKSSPTGGEVMPAAVSGQVIHEVAPRTVADTSGIPGVLAWDTRGWPGDGSSPVGALQHQHVTGLVTYTETPPVGGPHNGTWLNAGIYDQPVPSERAVHNLEHGAVWITYDSSLTASQLQALRSFVMRQAKLPEQTQTGPSTSRYIVMSPWAGSLPSPIVISAWGHQLRVSAVDDARLQRFVDTFRSSKTYTPEQGEAVDGVPVSVGGEPLES
jgi:Protein of unknown function (DUF3105)